MKKSLLTLLTLIAVSIAVWGQKTYIIKPPKNGQLYKPDLSYVQPGDTLKLEGDFELINIQDLHGDASRHIIITNKGHVEIGGYTAYTWIMMHCSYFDIIGKKLDDDYGLKINAKGQAIDLATPYCNNFSVQDMEIFGAGIGIQTKNNPVCGEAISQYGGFMYDNIKYLHLYIHDTKAEGLYFGYSGGTTSGCSDTTMQANYGHNVEIAFNKFENNGWDGIQAVRAFNISIHDNKVINYGVNNMSSQQTGIQVGDYSTAEIYNNTIVNGTGPGILSFAMDTVKIHNNIIKNAGILGNIISEKSDGMYLSTAASNPDKTCYWIYDNVIQGAARYGIHLPDYHKKAGNDNYVYKNKISGVRAASVAKSGFVYKTVAPAGSKH